MFMKKRQHAEVMARLQKEKDNKSTIKIPEQWEPVAAHIRFIFKGENDKQMKEITINEEITKPAVTERASVIKHTNNFERLNINKSQVQITEYGRHEHFRISRQFNHQIFIDLVFDETTNTVSNVQRAKEFNCSFSGCEKVKNVYRIQFCSSNQCHFNSIKITFMDPNKEFFFSRITNVPT